MGYSGGTTAVEDGDMQAEWTDTALVTSSRTCS